MRCHSNKTKPHEKPLKYAATVQSEAKKSHAMPHVLMNRNLDIHTLFSRFIVCSNYLFPFMFNHTQVPRALSSSNVSCFSFFFFSR